MSSTIVETESLTSLIPYEEVDDDQEHKTHVINNENNMHIWQPGMGPQDIVDLARITGEYIYALCGYKFIPKLDPEKHPACETCINLAGQILNEGG